MHGWSGRAIMYRCDPPLDGNEFVIVSTIDTPSQTAIFPAHIEPVKVEGKTLSIRWTAITESGVATHAAALQAQGYDIKEGAA